jgi:hypothetical protein
MQRMATTKTIPTTPTFEPTVERFREISLSAVEAYEKAGWGVAELQARVAKTSQVDWLTSVLDAQADLTRTVVAAQSSTARSVLS